MKRRALVALSLVTLVAAACQPEPPSGWVAPKIESIVVTPGTVVAGSPFTVTVVASDDHSVSGITLQLTTPYAFDGWPGAYPLADCAGGPLIAGAVATRSFTCSLPAAVANGQWTAEALAVDNEAPYSGTGQTTFEVVGGSEDRDKPVFVSETVSPNPVVVGQPFTVTIRVSDEHPSAAPREFFAANSSYGIPNPPPRVERSCGYATPTPVSPTVQDFVFGCVIESGAALGTYGGFVLVEDTLGHSIGIFNQFQVIAAP